MLIEPGRMELRDFDPPHPEAGEVLIEIKCALSCGTDLKTFRRGHPLFAFPMPFGHEFSGVVAETGSGVSTFKTGDGFMAAPTAPCGKCFYCSRRQENLCPDTIGRMVLGAYADYLLIPEHVVATNAFKKPPALSFEEAALLEPLSCVVHANEMANPQKHESVLIIGAGAFGLLHLLLLKAQQVEQVVVAGRRENRLKAAQEMGADHVFDVDRQPLAGLSPLNGGRGPDLVIEATGQLAGWEEAVRAVRPGGRVVFFGGCAAGTALSVDTRRMHYDNLTLMAPFHFTPRDVRRAFEMLVQDRLGAKRVIDAHRRLDELEEVFGLLERSAVLKCAVIP
jgi:L-iditol 2-dehydrogenase